MCIITLVIGCILLAKVVLSRWAITYFGVFLHIVNCFWASTVIFSSLEFTDGHSIFTIIINSEISSSEESTKNITYSLVANLWIHCIQAECPNTCKYKCM